jgi:hypothetical protein
MEHLRGTLLWLCTVSLVLSGFMGRGVVLCVRADGATALEQVSGDGRCLDGGVAYAAAAEDRAGWRSGDLVHCESTGCHDFTIADSLTRISSATPEASQTQSPLVLLTRIVLPIASAERTLHIPRHHPPTFFVSDVDAVRTTVSLIV